MRVVSFFKNVDLVLESGFKMIEKILMCVISIRKFDLFDSIGKATVDFSE
jgi:hypothetical protein